MILKASQRSGGGQLAVHLLRTDENDHVEVHDVRGFVTDNVRDAFKEAFAISRGTRCTQYLFSVSLNPPKEADVPIAIFEDAIARVERLFALSGHPRVIVFHEKEGRRHAHCVWSRINPSTMRAVNLPHFKVRLVELTRQIYIENGWKMPRGLIRTEDRNPLNFTREEWQQAKRIKRDPKAIKQIFQECWAVSDSMQGFRSALEARGYYLAQGDRRGHVAIDWKGEVYAVARWVGLKTKEVRDKLGEAEDLPTVASVQKILAERTETRLQQFSDELKVEFEGAQTRLNGRRDALVAHQRKERSDLQFQQTGRWAEESRQRAERFRRGLRGLWDRITGRHSEVRRENELEVRQAMLRDRVERETLIFRQMEERKHLQQQLEMVRKNHDGRMASLQGGAPVSAIQAPARDRLIRSRQGRRSPRDRSLDI